MPDWLLPLLQIISAPVGVVIGYWMARRKTSAEAHKAEAEADKIDIGSLSEVTNLLKQNIKDIAELSNNNLKQELARAQEREQYAREMAKLQQSNTLQAQQIGLQQARIDALSEMVEELQEKFDKAMLERDQWRDKAVMYEAELSLRNIPIPEGRRRTDKV